MSTTPTSARSKKQTKVYLLGHANTGKTTIFNVLTGANDKVANYHGATTKLSKKALLKNPGFHLYDLPGTYALAGHSKDESLTVETLKSATENSTLVFVLDGVNLKHQFLNLKAFLSKFTDVNQHVVIAINMIDEVKQNQIEIDFKKLDEDLDVPIIGVSAKKKIGLAELETAITNSPTYKLVNLKTFSEKIEALDLESLITNGSKFKVKRMHKIDEYLISPIWGTLFFIFSMSVLFQAIFSWSAPFMNLIENSIVFFSSYASDFTDQIYIKSFIEDALFGGLGAFLVFTPQIFFLSFIIKNLEETGYLARASIICHKILMLFGLSGESFIPILTSHACAIPGIYAARHIKSNRIRILTILSLPLTLCSARLPVYALLITLIIPNYNFLGGLIGARGLMLFALYLFGLSLTLFVSYVLSKASPSSEKPFLAVELPRYQLPSLQVCVKGALSTTYRFIKDAGPVIFVVNSVVWALATFPNGPGNLNTSFLSRIGTLLLPLSRPLGLDWPETIALLTSFLARETFVSTLGTLYGTESEDISTLSELIINNAENNSTASVLSLIVFFAIALQCISTLAVLRKELPKKISVYTIFLGYLAFAYTASFLTYRLALLIFS